MRARKNAFAVFCFGIRLALAICAGTVAWSVPVINSVQVTPTPLRQGAPFSISAVASADVTQATATVDFRPAVASLLRVTLSKQGGTWTGSGVVPSHIPVGTEATVKVLVLDAARARAEATLRVLVVANAEITAVFNPVNGILTIAGNSADNSIFVSRDAAGVLVVNGGAVPVLGGIATVANTVQIRILGFGGNDSISIDSSGGALPATEIDGGTGNDTVTIPATNGADVFGAAVSAGNVSVFGLLTPVTIVGSDPANDRLVLNALGGDDVIDASSLAAGLIQLTLNGGLGDDVFLGSQGNDLILGGDGDDVALCGAGDDTFTWNPGDDNDTIEGQAGQDRLLFNGANVAENISISPNGGRVIFFRDIANVVMDMNDVEVLDFNAIGGADTIVVNDVSGTDLIDVNLNLAATGGGGDAQPDTVNVAGTTGNDLASVVASAGGISINGLSVHVDIAGHEPANDRLGLFLGGGNDEVDVSGLGGGGVNLTIEGQAGQDRLYFTGANVAENVAITPNGVRVLFTRDIGNLTFDLNGVEVLDYNALGGTDSIVVGDLSGTGVTTVGLDLANPAGTGIGDGETDAVTVSGTNGDDVIDISGTTGIAVVGSAVVTILAPEAIDRLTVNSLGGDDVINASSLAAGQIQLLLNGGLGDDILLGSQGNDLIEGGDGDDVALCGAGDDMFVWKPGDDNDTIEGQSGFDQLLFNGANVSENITIFANGGRVIFFRNIANVVMDMNDVEGLDFNALGGADVISVNDLSGTDLTEANLNLAATGGTGDGQPDTVIAQGTNGDDVALVVGDANGVSVFGLAAQINIVGSEAANDRLTVNLLAGDDVLEASGLAAGVIALTGDGGNDDDILVGSDGPDILLGGAGDDVLIGGLGLDVLDGGSGDNVVIQ